MSLVNKLLTDLERDSHPQQPSPQPALSGMRPAPLRISDPYILYHTKTLVAFLLSFGLLFGGLFALYEFTKPPPAASVASSGPLPVKREPPAPVADATRAAEEPEKLPAIEPEKPVAKTEIKKAEPEPEPARVAIQPRQATPQEQAEAMYIKARGLRMQGRMVEAEAAYNAALSHNPAHLAARTELVQAMAEAQRWPDALRVVSEGLTHHPRHEEMLLWRARILYDQGQKALALETLETLDLDQIGNPDTLALLAVLYYEQKDYFDAAQAYRLALAQRPNEGRWWLGLGAALESSNENKTAQDAYLRALNDSTLAPHLSQYAQQRLAQLREAAL